MRIGQAVDIHQLVEGRPLVLGGVQIEHEKGLLGHSDADVLVHAIAESILGALALGDLGKHFPDTDPKYKGINSMLLLGHVTQLMEAKGYRIGNVDATILAERPRWHRIFIKCKKILLLVCIVLSNKFPLKQLEAKNWAL